MGDYIRNLLGRLDRLCADSVWGRMRAGVRLFSDACAAKEVTFNDAVIPHDVVHNTHLGTIARFASVLPTGEA